jgi:hypothetical protein
MKAGRPSYHIPSRWVTVTTPKGVLYFALDDKGNLVRGEGKEIRPERIAPLVSPAALVAPVPRPRKPPKTSATPITPATPPIPVPPANPPATLVGPPPADEFDPFSLEGRAFYFEGFSELTEDFPVPF